MASFMYFPTKLRLKVYSHLLPGLGQYPSTYLGLRNSCRAEYDHEAAKTIPHIYANAPLKLHTVDNVAWWTIAHLSAVTMQPTVFVVNRIARFPKKMIPWHWTWLKTLVVEFDMNWASCYTHYTDAHALRKGEEYGPEKDPATNLMHSAVGMAFERMDSIIKARIGTTIRRRRSFEKKDCRRPVKCEIDTFVLRWEHFPSVGNNNNKYVTPPPVLLPPRAALPSNHDRLWDVTFGFNGGGGLVEITWRRRTMRDARRDAEEDFMPVPEWLGLPSRCE